MESFQHSPSGLKRSLWLHLVDERIAAPYRENSLHMGCVRCAEQGGSDAQPTVVLTNQRLFERLQQTDRGD